MNFLQKLFRKRTKQELRPLKTERPSIGMRLARHKTKYMAKMAITYKDEPIRQFETIINASSRDHAAYKAQQGLGIKLVSVVKIKKK